MFTVSYRVDSKGNFLDFMGNTGKDVQEETINFTKIYRDASE